MQFLFEKGMGPIKGPLNTMVSLGFISKFRIPFQSIDKGKSISVQYIGKLSHSMI